MVMSVISMSSFVRKTHLWGGVTADVYTVIPFQQTTKRKSASIVSWGETCVCAVFFFFNWIWQKPDLAACSAGCFRSCNYHFSSSCLFHAFNRYTDGLNHCQTTAQPDWPQSFWIAGKAFEWLEGQTDTQTVWKSESLVIYRVLFTAF